jgi:two-component system sensor histidine kinase CreC
MLAGLAWAARWVTRPLDLLTRHALAVSHGQRPVPPRMPGHHLKTLGRAFEDMREALEGREYVESYVQSLTHELKSPVAAIMGAAEILDGDVPEPRRRRFLQNIRAEAARLHDLIDRMLQLTGLEKQKALAHPEPVDVRQLVERSWDHLEASAAARGLAWELQGTPGTVISGDPWLMELAIGNLLQNAIEFSPPGGRIRATIEPGAGELRLHLDDEGPGIPDYAADRIFERFYSLPRPETGKKSSGLGLCFVREIAHLHRGGIVLKNREEGGVRATLTLPA